MSTFYVVGQVLTKDENLSPSWDKKETKQIKTKETKYMSIYREDVSWWLNAVEQNKSGRGDSDCQGEGERTVSSLGSPGKLSDKVLFE